MELQTVIFLGSQGSGKGTQADLLITHLKRADAARAVLAHDTGAGFRTLFKERAGNYTAELVKESLNQGNLQPSFLPIYLWTSDFLEGLTSPETHIVIDGSPRTPLQAAALDEAFEFYSRTTVSIVYLKLGTDVSVKRLLARGRPDDAEAAIRRRLELYEKQTAPLLVYFKERPRYIIHEVDGDASIEAIHQDILSKLSLT